MRNIKSALNARVLLSDSASESMWQDLDHTIEPVEILNITNPDLILKRHIAYLKAGADVIHTNSFGAFPLDLKGEGYAEEAFIINYLGAEIAARAIDSVPGLGRRRFVAGVIQTNGLEGLASDIEAGAGLQTEGLIAGGVDSLAVHLTDDGLNTISLLKGIIAKRDNLNPQLPVYIYRKHRGNNQTLKPAKLADAILNIADGKTTGDRWLTTMLGSARPNLITGGDSAHDTALIDVSLRAYSQDGLRPTLKSKRGNLDEGFMPASSSRYFTESKAFKESADLK